MLSKDVIIAGKRIVRQTNDTVGYIISKKRFSVSLKGIRNFHFICYGNICRSAFAEHYARKLFLQEGIDIGVASSGLSAKQGESPPENAIIAADRFHVDLQGHLPRLLNDEMVEQSCMIVGMHYYHYIEFQKRFVSYRDKFNLLKHLAWPAYYFFNIDDPFGKPLDEYIKTFGDIRNCIDIMAQRLKSGIER